MKVVPIFALPLLFLTFGRIVAAEDVPLGFGFDSISNSATDRILRSLELVAAAPKAGVRGEDEVSWFVGNESEAESYFASISARAKFWRVARGSFRSEFSSNSNTATTNVYLRVTTFRDFGASLALSYQGGEGGVALKERFVDGFEKTADENPGSYGDYVCVGYRRRASVSVTYTLKSVSLDFAKRLSVDASAQFKAGFGSVAGDGSIRGFLEKHVDEWDINYAASFNLPAGVTPPPINGVISKRDFQSTTATIGAKIDECLKLATATNAPIERPIFTPLSSIYKKTASFKETPFEQASSFVLSLNVAVAERSRILENPTLRAFYAELFGAKSLEALQQQLKILREKHAEIILAVETAAGKGLALTPDQLKFPEIEDIRRVGVVVEDFINNDRETEGFWWGYIDAEKVGLIRTVRVYEPDGSERRDFDNRGISAKCLSKDEFIASLSGLYGTADGGGKEPKIRNFGYGIREAVQKMVDTDHRRFFLITAANYKNNQNLALCITDAAAVAILQRNRLMTLK